MEAEPVLVPLNSQKDITHDWLQQVMRNGLDPSLKLVSWTAKPLEKGAGYASDMSIVRASYCTQANADVVNSSLCVKLLPENEGAANFVRNGNLGMREVEFYKYAASEEFKTFCQKSGSPNLIPCVYWAGIDNDRFTVVLEDLTLKDFKSLVPPEGISLKQAKATLSAVATVHAAGFTAISKHGTHQLDIPWDAHFLQKEVEMGLKRLVKMYADTPMAGTLKTYFSQIQNLVYVDLTYPFMKTLIHGDLWTGNVLFSNDGSDVRIIDWQFAHFGNPVCDIQILLFLSCNSSVYEDNLTEVLECYWSSFEQALLKNEVTLEPSFTFEDLLETVDHLWLFGFMFFAAAVPDLLDYNKMSVARAQSVISFLNKRGVFTNSVPLVHQRKLNTPKVMELPPLKSDKEISQRWLEEMLARKIGCAVGVKFWSVRLPEGREGFLSEVAFVEIQYEVIEGLMREDSGSDIQKGLENEGSKEEKREKTVECQSNKSLQEGARYTEEGKMKGCKATMKGSRCWSQEEEIDRKDESCQLVFKFLPHDSDLQSFMAKGGLAEREVEFYKFISSKEFKVIHTELPVPEVYFADYSEDAITLVLRDLNQDKYSSVIVRDGSTLDQTKTALRAMAIIHGAGYLYLCQYGKQNNLATLAAEFRNDFYDQFFLPNLNTLVEMYKGTSLADIFKALIPLTKEIRSTSHRNPFLETVVHGDLWAGQLLYSHDQQAVSVIDWQFCHLDNPVSDLMSMFFMSTDPWVLENHLPEILEDYWKTFCKVLEKGDGDKIIQGRPVDTPVLLKTRNNKNYEQEGSSSLDVSGFKEPEGGLEQLAANVEDMWMYGFMFLAVSLHDFLNGDNISRDRLDGAMTFLERRGVFSKFLAEFGDK